MAQGIPGGMELSVILLLILLLVVPIAGIAKVFSKAGEPWWAAIIPLYNIYVMTKIGGISPLWILVWLIPYLNIIAALKTSVAVSKTFGAGTLFGVGMAILPWIGWPLLGFGKYEYQHQADMNADPS